MQVNNCLFHSKGKTFKAVRSAQIKTFNYLLDNKYTPPNTLEDPNYDSIKDKGVYNLSSKPLSVAEKSLLKKGPTFAITPTTCLSLTILLPPNTSTITWVKTLLLSKLTVEYYTKVKK